MVALANIVTDPFKLCLPCSFGMFQKSLGEFHCFILSCLCVLFSESQKFQLSCSLSFRKNANANNILIEIQITEIDW